MGRRRTGNASIPAPGDGAGESWGGAAPGSKGRETASGRSEERAAASETTAKTEADLSTYKWLMVPRPTRTMLLRSSLERDVSPRDEVRAAELVGGTVRLLSIHVDYIYDFGRRALIRRTRDSEAVMRDKLLSVEEAYKYVVEDVQGIARHISDRADKLPALTRVFLKALMEVEGATRYPEAFEQEKPWEERSGGEEVG
jgi:hypothetical protein